MDRQDWRRQSGNEGRWKSHCNGWLAWRRRPPAFHAVGSVPLRGVCENHGMSRLRYGWYARGSCRCSDCFCHARCRAGIVKPATSGAPQVSHASMWRCSSFMATIVRLKNGRKKTARRYSARHCRRASSSPSNRGWMSLSCRSASSRARTRQRSGVSQPRGSARSRSLALIAAGRSEAVS